MIEGLSLNSELQSTSAPNWFTFPPDGKTQFWPTSDSLDQDLPFCMLSGFPTTFPTSHDGSLAEPIAAADAPVFPSLMPQAQDRHGRVQLMNSSVSLPRRRSRYNVHKFGHKTEAIPIPITAPALDPLQRWHESPPEDEPASMSAIMQAVNMSKHSTFSEIGGVPTPAHASFRDHRRPVSVTSSNSGNSISSRHSSGSRQSASVVQNPLAAQSFDGSTRITKNAKSRTSNASSRRRNFPCTFCCDTFKNKHDWSRHERTLHMNLGGWMCAPNGGAPISPTTGRRHCAFCSCLDPSPEHLDQHHYAQCSSTSRTFRRKDHLVQHLRLVHRLDVLPLMDTWRTPEPVVTSRCGFCDCRLDTWNERAEHLAAHFREGRTMDEWRGEHGFPLSVAAMVTNSLPPYLISAESKTVVPFSATNANVKDHFAQISRRANGAEDEEARLTTSFQQLQATEEKPLGTFAELLTQHLGRYARQQMSLGIVPTDEMFQDQARRLLYDSEDSWNQTIADNPEWITSFRQQHSPHYEQLDNPDAADSGNTISLSHPGT